MKKFLAVIICVITIFTAFLSGCSCAPTSIPLEFNNLAVAVHESQKLDQNTVEKHIYSVKLNTDYSAQMKLDEYLITPPLPLIQKILTAVIKWNILSHHTLPNPLKTNKTKYWKTVRY